MINDSIEDTSIFHCLREACDNGDTLLPFSQFMATCLYAPSVGYYTAAPQLFSKTADFTTAPETSSLFGACLARACVEGLRALGGKTILEFGAGSGRLAEDILQTLERQGALPERYLIVEKSPMLVHRQRERLAAWGERVCWQEAISENFEGVVLANEVLDALPVDCFEVSDGVVYQRMVRVQEDKVTWQRGEKAGAHLQALQTEYQWPEGYCSEDHAGLRQWLPRVFGRCQRVLMFLMDYGYGEAEYYQAARKRGTLCCYHQNHAHDDPLVHLGKQDITAHVNFTQVAELAVQHGLEVNGFCHQNAFLLDAGILEEVASCADFSAQYGQHQEIKSLLSPSGMGTAMKVMTLSKNFEAASDRVSQQDLRYQL